jgi:hypothetical protein
MRWRCGGKIPPLPRVPGHLRHAPDTTFAVGHPGHEPVRGDPAARMRRGSYGTLQASWCEDSGCLDWPRLSPDAEWPVK